MLCAVRESFRARERLQNVNDKLGFSLSCYISVKNTLIRTMICKTNSLAKTLWWDTLSPVLYWAVIVYLTQMTLSLGTGRKVWELLVLSFRFPFLPFLSINCKEADCMVVCNRDRLNSGLEIGELESVQKFKYLGNVVTDDENVAQRSKGALEVWKMPSRV